MPQWLVIGISGVTCGGKTSLSYTLRDYFKGLNGGQLWNTPYAIGDVQLISQDDYFLPVDDLRHKWNDKLNAINFELITSLDMKQLMSDITWTMKGRYLAGDPMDNNIEYINDMSMYTNFEHYATQYQQQYQQPLQQQQQQQQQQATSQQHHNQQHPYQQQQQRHQSANAAHIMRVSSQIATQLRDNKINILIIEGFMIFNHPDLLTLSNIKFHFHLPYEKCYERRRKRNYNPPDVTGYFEICVWPHYEKNFAEYRDRKDITFLNGELPKEKIFKYVVQCIMHYFEERCDVACPPPQKIFGMLGTTTPAGNNNGNTQLTTIVCPMEQQ